MAPDLVLKESCSSCGATGDLYGSNCRHLTLCVKCGKFMAETAAPCPECGTPITRLIREYNVRAQTINKQHFVGRFLQGLPAFSKKKASGTRWSLQREGLQGRQLTEALREKYKGKSWILEDEIGQQQFQGQLEGGQQATYFILMMHGQEFLAFPAGAWYNFNKVAQYKQLTLEEAEEQMKNRRKTAEGYQRWMMKANTGAAAAAAEGGGGGGGSRKKAGNEEDIEADSDRGEDDMDDEEARKTRLGMNKSAKGGDEDGEEPANEHDLDDEEPERGDDWEHEETFTDDDEAVGNDPEEREEQVPEGPAPPEIKQEEEDELNQEGQQNEEGAGGLSKSGRELKKLLGKQGLDDSDGEDDEEEDEDVDLDNEEIGMSPVLAPTRKDNPKEEPAETTPAKATGGKTPSSATPAKGKRKAIAADGESKPTSNKKAKGETDKGSKASAASATKKETAKAGPGSAKGGAAAKAAAAGGGVSEEEAKALLRQTGPIKSQDLVAKFKSRLKTTEDKAAFAQILKKISRIQKTDGVNYIVLRDK